MKSSLDKKSVFKLIKEGFFGGIGWAAGVTVGFALVSTIVIYSLQLAGGIPIVGRFFAQIVDSTLLQLDTKAPQKTTK
jgi:Domain of unknown function (DUF5665)